MSSYRTNNIKIILEKLESLKIINKASEGTYKQSDKEISVAPALANKNIQAVISKSMVLDPGWFDGD